MSAMKPDKSYWNFMDEDPAYQVAVLAVVVLVIFMLIVIITRISLWLNPPKKYDPNWSSYSINGWRMNPRKLGTARMVEMVVEPKKLEKMIKDSEKSE